MVGIYKYIHLYWPSARQITGTLFFCIRVEIYPIINGKILTSPFYIAPVKNHVGPVMRLEIAIYTLYSL
jgi:hypothetical protein